ncbi:MAG TPA: enoyl-CoA hydratase-related protein [Acidimicrobiia bacterium]|nr:enoyl-CoA hydratase-related protein [Acidimicrobiia bacterium]
MLHIDDSDRVRLLTLDRPEARNALDDAHYHALADAFEDATDRGDLAVVTLTGTSGAFCAGQDLAEMGRLGDAPPTAGDATRGAHGFTRFVAALEAFPKPIVAAVNGVAVGLGVTMLPYCDLVLVADDARLRTPFASLGVVPEAGSSFTLPAAMGRQAAAHVLLAGAWFDAATAVTSGLAWKSVPAARLLDEALDAARAMARLPIVSLCETKRLMRSGWLAAAQAARTREEAVFAELTGAPANREAITAFLEKREPDFVNLPSD